MEAVRRQGAPTVALNFEPADLVGVWEWFVATQERPRGPATDDEMRRANPPWWYDFYSPLGRQIGPIAARLVSPLAAYLSETIIRARPASKWVLGTGRDDPGIQGAPVLAVDGGGRFLPDAVVLSCVAGWSRGDPTSPENLLFLHGIYTGLKVVYPPFAATTPYSIARGRPGEFETEIIVADEVAWDEDPRIDDLVAALGSIRGIERVVREDREVVLIRAPTIDDRTLTAMVDRLWGDDGSAGG